MYWTLEPVSGPVGGLEPVTLAEMRTHLREFDDVTARDSDITEMIKAAREWAEDYTGRALIDQTWRLTVGSSYDPNAPARVSSGYFDSYKELMLRRSPVLAISSFQSVNGAGEETAIDAAGYELKEASSKWPRLAVLSGATWHSTANIGLQVVFRAGYADRTGSPQTDASVVPARFKQAIKLHVQAHYDQDADMGKLLAAAKNLLKGERCHVGFA